MNKNVKNSESTENVTFKDFKAACMVRVQKSRTVDIVILTKFYFTIIFMAGYCIVYHYLLTTL